ncbi:MAG: virulence-associated protein E, partial [Blautia sp.]|nr:virulence-associated protein E [Blautia sp.]
MSADPLLKDGTRFNELTQRIDVVKYMGWDRGKTTGLAMTDDDLYNMHLYCDKTYGITSLKQVEEAVHIVAHRNAYHPIRDILN